MSTELVRTLVQSTTLAKMPTDAVIKRAALLLAGGKVRVTQAADAVFFADVQGSQREPYVTSYGYPHAGAWHCTCPAHRVGHRECSHIVACDRIWQPELSPRADLRAVPATAG